MLSDPGNIFGKALALTDMQSALSVMRAHRELILPQPLDGGPLAIVLAVLPYISDTDLRKSVHQQLKHYYGDQGDMKQKAELVALRWLDFEAELAESLATSRCTIGVENFIHEMSSLWNDADMQVINKHSFAHGMMMTRELAIVLERAKRNVLWASAATTVQNEYVADQMDSVVFAQIRTNEMLIQMAMQNGWDYTGLEAENHRLVANQNVNVGGGCPGDVNANFKGQVNSSDASKAEKSEKKWMNCPHCKARVFDDPCARVLACWDCRAKVVNGRVMSKGDGGSRHRAEEQQALAAKETQERALKLRTLSMESVGMLAVENSQFALA